MDYNQYPDPPDISSPSQLEPNNQVQTSVTNQPFTTGVGPISPQSNVDIQVESTTPRNKEILVKIAVVLCILSISLVIGLFSNGKDTKKTVTTNDTDYANIENNSETVAKTPPIEEKTNTESETKIDINTKTLNNSTIYDMVKVAHGNNHDCGIYTDNKAYCWGSGAYGQLGAGLDVLSSDNPVAVIDTGVLASLTIKHIASGDNHTCVIASDDQAYCWGVGTYGQLGYGDDEADNYLPRAVYRFGALKDKTLVSIDASNNYTCAVASDSHTYCWGMGIFGKDEHQNLKSNLLPTLVN